MATKAKWSQTVTETSNAMDIADNTFNQSDPKKIAEMVEHDAEVSGRRKSSPYRSAMSMLTFYMNRAGKNLSAKQRKVLDEAKVILREEFGPGDKVATKKPASRKKAASKKVTSTNAAPKRKKASAAKAKRGRA